MNVRMNMYVMFLLRQQRLNKLIIIIISHYRLLNMYEHWEGLIVQINGGNLSKSITIGNIYRPPRTDLLEQMVL